MKLQLARGLSIRRSLIHGKGCFATQSFRRRHKIAEYAGEKISNAEAKRRAYRKTLRICEVNRRWSLDGSRGGNGTHYINHSCTPNAFMQILYDHILFIALRDIRAGEEITIDSESTPTLPPCCSITSRTNARPNPVDSSSFSWPSRTTR